MKGIQVFYYFDKNFDGKYYMENFLEAINSIVNNGYKVSLVVNADFCDAYKNQRTIIKK
ncbi:MAG: hypothetical protein GX190_04905 [Mollicutes bacterium]|nr:hypothetical protein [Mollicutes bacterium]